MRIICFIATLILLGSFVGAQEVIVTDEVRPQPVPLIFEENRSEEPTEAIETIQLFDIPLEDDLQTYIFEQAEERGVDPAIVIAIIKRESNFDILAVGDEGNSLGLMQIQPRWSVDRMEELECDNLLDPYQNVKVGIDILADLIEEKETLEWVLMAYNGGNAYADRLAKEGRVSEYAKKVIEMSEELERK